MFAEILVAIVRKCLVWEDPIAIVLFTPRMGMRWQGSYNH